MTKNKKVKVKDLTVTATEFAQSIKRKWIIYSSLGILVVFLIIVFQGRDGATAARNTAQPAFQDLTPENTDETQVLRSIQASLREIKEASKKEKEASKKLEEKLSRQIINLQNELKEKTKTSEELDKKLNELQAVTKKQEEAIKSAAKTSPAAAMPDINTGKIEIPAKTPNSNVPPPPPIYVDKDDKPSGTRSNLPANNIPAVNTDAQKSIVITGDEKRSSNVLVGTKKQQTKSKQKKQINSFLPAGSFVKVALLTAADFGAGKQTQSNPQPVLMRLQSDAILPGMARYKLKSCFAIGNGYGELSSHRVHIQVSRLSCVQEGTGKVLSAQVLGWINDSDSTQGLRGTIQRREGMLLGKALLAGFAEGMAKVMNTAAQNSETVITGAGVVSTIDSSKAAEMAGWSGIENAMTKLANRYIEEANGIFPVIEITPGRRGSLVFQNGQNLEWKTADEI